MRVVFDTNVLVAATRSKKGASYQLISMVPTHKFQLALSLPLYLEYLDVLLRPGIKPTGVEDADIVDFVDQLLADAEIKNIYFLWRHTLPDRKDDMVLEVAVASQAEYIVTFNVRDFVNIELFGIEVIRPNDFLDIVRKI
jgi:putative PIN family toxin of toxin-antitoxin system